MMHAIVTALAEQQAELSALLSGRDERDWQRDSRCDGWTVADVVLHLAQTDALALASVQGRFDKVVQELTQGLSTAGSVDDGSAFMVARERGQPAAAIHERWQSGAAALCDALQGRDPRDRVVWVAGELTARTLASTRLAETWIHTDDVAAAFDTVLAPTDRLWHIARLAWRTLPYAFARSGRELAGPVAFELRSPSGAGWDFVPDAPPLTTIRGAAAELCAVAARRADPADTSVRGDGPDAGAVLELVRTYA